MGAPVFFDCPLRGKQNQRQFTQFIYFYSPGVATASSYDVTAKVNRLVQLATSLAEAA